jgi:heme/copper-type cytochrome/quinol oxidase subunit 2
MREGIANAAAIQVDDVILLAAGENHAVAKSIGALGANQARIEQPFQGVGEGLQVRAQVAAAGIADAEFLDDPRIVHSALREILNAFMFVPHCVLVPAGVPVHLRITSADVVHLLTFTGTDYG